MLVGMAVGLALVAGACGGSGENSSGDAESSSGGGSADGSGGGGGAVAVEVLAGAVEVRDVVYTAEIDVRVGDVTAASTDAVAIARGAGGFLARESADLEGDGESRLTLRVPGTAFDEVLEDLGGLGTVRDRRVEAVDVTDEVVDVEGRLATLHASADRLRTLLAEADSTADIVAVEGELAQREADIESLEGRLRVLEGQVGLATIEVALLADRGVGVDDELPGFVDSLRSGGVAVVSALVVAAAVFGFLLPFVPFVAAGWFLYRWVGKRRSRRPRNDPRPPPPVGFGGAPPGGMPPGAGPGRAWVPSGEPDRSHDDDLPDEDAEAVPAR